MDARCTVFRIVRAPPNYDRSMFKPGRSSVATYGARFDLREFINLMVNFTPTPDGRGFVATRRTMDLDLWMLTGLDLKR